jgi:catechol 2,3-dioxygenase-like lactoylglutathione lyase family enzyme
MVDSDEMNTNVKPIHYLMFSNLFPLLLTKSILLGLRFKFTSCWNFSSFQLDMKPFEIRFIDHVAIRVRDQQKSIEWYQKVLGLRIAEFPNWKNYPVFMSGGDFGLAIFPAKTSEPEIDKSSKNSRIDHFAFNLSSEDFEKARQHFEAIGIDFQVQDHYYFYSLYTKDPDGHTVELTTSVRSAP